MGHALFIDGALLLLLVLLAVYALKKLSLPTIPAYFIVGLLAGPSSLGILHSGETANQVAELGIILLLFTIGLKFNLSSLRSMKRFVFVFGGLQVALTALLVTVIAYIVLRDFFIATLIGFIVAMSSTAIVSQVLIEKNAVNQPIGRRAMGVLLFQDLIVIPLLILYSSADGQTSIWVSIILVAGKTALTLVIAMVAGPWIMRRALDWVVRMGDKESFALSIVALIIVSSLLTGVSGLSPVLGAFLAGVLVAETYHRYRVEQIIEPFRQLFLGFFFMSLGILIDPAQVLENIQLISALSLIFLFVKTPLIFWLMWMLKTYPRTAWQTAFLLGGAGEFGFALFAVARDSGVLSEELFQLLVPVNLLGIVFTPLLVNNLQPYLDKWMAPKQKEIKAGSEADKPMEGHIVVCGFGRTGQAVFNMLSELPVKFVILEEDSILLQMLKPNDYVIYGSSDNAAVLQKANVASASAMIITFADEVTASLTIQAARRLNPDLYIIAKAVSNTQAKNFARHGASKVLIEAYESGISMAKESLLKFGDVSREQVNQVIAMQDEHKIRAVLGDTEIAIPDEGMPAPAHDEEFKIK